MPVCGNDEANFKTLKCKCRGVFYFKKHVILPNLSILSVLEYAMKFIKCSRYHCYTYINLQ